MRDSSKAKLCSLPNFFRLVLQPKANPNKGLEEEQGKGITLGNNGASEADLDHAGVSAPLAAQGRHARTSTDPHHQTSMQIKSCLSQVRWFTGFAEDPPAFPTEWQARLGTALRHWWQTLPETEGDHHGEHICAGLDLICGITGVDVGHTRTDREPTVGGLTGHVDECGESRGDHVPVPRRGKGSIREAREGTPKHSCGSRAACKPTSSTEAPTSSTKLLLRAVETDLGGASRQVVALGA